MDIVWSEQTRRHKRSFQEVDQADQSASPPLSPNSSPDSNLRAQQHPRARNRRRLSSNTIVPSTLNQHRTSRPHSPVFATMASNSRPRSRVAPENRDRTAVIDLTTLDSDELEEVNVVPRNRLHSGRARQPPQLGRSDASLLEVIDLTEDLEPEIVASGARAWGGLHGRRRIHPRMRRQESPPLFVDAEPRRQDQAQGQDNARLIALNHRMRMRPIQGHMGQEFGEQPGGPHAALHVNHFVQEFLQQREHIYRIHDMAMPGIMDYANPAVRNRKPEYVAPPPAREGFTRSLNNLDEDDMVVCASCENELVYRKGVVESPTAKRGGKAPTKKEIEEQLDERPFWVINACSHVYCRKCFLHRNHGSNAPEGVQFREKRKSNKTNTKVPICSVEGCESEVKERKSWTGTFLS
ncbi:hypothetical protein HYFRA_00011921 [Hymenoscyphus fraxineus]|uniref:Cell cycle control protein n=1 Tax=Hymenoscyphus fraxineus TaxID=746836 RepID=A0A9N9L2N8_9HELO|nr:hypothetical protein HYFRA_00011921 [Hymenoscyphus fraxineus]